MIRSAAVLMALIVVVAVAPLAATAEPTMSGLAPLELPEGAGKDDVAAYCSACHSLSIVAQQRLGREDWNEVLVSMVEQEGMPEIPAEDRKTILDYLAQHLGPDHRPASLP